MGEHKGLSLDRPSAPTSTRAPGQGGSSLTNVGQILSASSGSCPKALAGSGLGAMAQGLYAKGNVFPGWCPGAGFRGGSWAVLVATSTPCFRGGSRERDCNAGSGPGVWGRAQGLGAGPVY